MDGRTSAISGFFRASPRLQERAEMDGDWSYSMRTRSSRRGASASSSAAWAASSATSRSRAASPGTRMRTPEPVQRTLDLQALGALDEDEPDELEALRRPTYRSSLYREREDADVDASDGDDGEALDDEEEDEEDEGDELLSDEPDESEDEDERRHNLRTRRSTLARRAASAAALFNPRSDAAARVRRQIASWPAVKKISKHFRRFWRFVVRNSFMAVNVLWLLAPLCCFAVAIAVPQYLTAAIRYVDNITTSMSGAPVGLGAYDKGAMRTLVQELVDVKLSAMGSEIVTLRQALQAQERDVEALRLVHEAFRQVHDETQHMFSLAEADSALSVHIERVVTRHSDELLEERLETTAKEQAVMMDLIKDQHDDVEDLRRSTTGAVGNSNANANSNAAAETLTREQSELKKELRAWRDSMHQELQRDTQRELQNIEDRMSKALLAEKQLLDASAQSLRNLNAADPALLAVVEGALAVAESKRVGRVDHAALANGASVVYTERDLLHPDEFLSLESLGGLVGLQVGRDDSSFTSPSYRSARSAIGLALSSCEQGPWWLSRHNGRPETALSETMEVGSCWGMAGPDGRLSVKFAHQIIADAVSIDHIPAQIAADFGSAPHEFQILGISGNPLRDTVEFVPFGNFSYVRGGPSRQTFQLTSPASQRTAVDGIAIAIKSNHGNPAFTCLYRFQVHGQVVE